MTVKNEKEEREPQIEEGNRFALEMDHFSTRAMANREPKTPCGEGLRDVRIMQAVDRAAAEGRPSALDAATGSVRP